MKNKKKNLILTSIMILISILGINILLNSDKISVIYAENGEELYSIKNSIINSSENSEDMLISESGVSDSIVSQVIDDMINELGYTKEKAINIINNKGVKINSTVDLKLQNNVDVKFNDRKTFTDIENIEYAQSAFVIMDYDGNVKAVATGNNSDKSKNRATQSLLKPASTIKPIAIYTPAFESDKINFTTIIDDIPSTTYINGKPTQWPQNYDDNYGVNVTIDEAITKSKNTIAVKVGQLIGVNNSFDFLKNKLRFNTLAESNVNDDDRQLAALALGYLNNGITLDKLVSAYQIFGNGGYYTEPKLYTTVEDKDGNVILKNNRKTNQIISEETATIMNRLLVNVVNDKDGTANSCKIDGVEIAGKTGTIGDGRDVTSQLFVGMTPSYVAGVWIGFDNEKPLIRNSYNSPNLIWKEIMKDNLGETLSFELSGKVSKLEYCIFSGMLISDKCTKAKNGYYKYSNKPDICNRCN